MPGLVLVFAGQAGTRRKTLKNGLHLFLYTFDNPINSTMFAATRAQPIANVLRYFALLAARHSPPRSSQTAHTHLFSPHCSFTFNAFFLSKHFTRFLPTYAHQGCPTPPKTFDPAGLIKPTGRIHSADDFAPGCRNWHSWKMELAGTHGEIPSVFLSQPARISFYASTHTRFYYFRNDTIGTVNLKSTRQTPVKSVPIEVKDAAPVMIYYTSSNQDGNRVVSRTDDHTF